MGTYPLLRLLIPFAMGITTWLITAWNFTDSVFYSIFAGLFFILLIFLHGRFSSYKYRWIPGVLLYSLFFITGYYHSQAAYHYFQPDHFKRYAGVPGLIRVRIIEPPAEKPNTYQLVCHVEQFLNDSLKRNTRGRLIIYIQKDSLAGKLEYGDFIIVSNEFREVSPPGNPGEFDYRKYLRHRNIFHQQYIRSGHWYFTGENKVNHLFRLSLDIRKKSLEILGEANLPQREFSVVSSLVLGYREELDEDLRQEFSGAGAMHILCVSGLHVGIIMLIFKFLFSPLIRFKNGKLLRTILIVLLILVYACITGLSPSVLRASVMFSFVAIGQSFRRTTNIFNTLGGSALVLLIADPFLITHAGFQLSYLAVAGIVTIQPWLYRMVFMPGYLADKAWAIITVSIAAQIATAPLSVFYFNQFPNYFLITNLAVLPLASLMIFAAFFFLVFSSVPYLGWLASQILYLSAFLMQNIVKLVEGLPFAITKGLYINFTETLIIIGFIILTGMYIHSSGKIKLYFPVLLVLFFSTSVTSRKIRNMKNNQVIVYDVRNGLSVDFFSNYKCVYLQYYEDPEDSPGLEYNVSGHRLRMGAGPPVVSLDLHKDDVYKNNWLFKSGPFICFNNHTFLFLVAGLKYDSGLSPPVSVDYLVVGQNSLKDFRQLIETWKPKMIIFDSSLKRYNVIEWTEICQQSEISYWDVFSRGAFIRNF